MLALFPKNVSLTLATLDCICRIIGLTQFHVQLIDHVVGIPKWQLIAIVAAHIPFTRDSQLGKGGIIAAQSSSYVGSLLVHRIAPSLIVEHCQIEGLTEIGMSQTSGALLLLMQRSFQDLVRIREH